VAAAVSLHDGSEASKLTPAGLESKVREWCNAAGLPAVRTPARVVNLKVNDEDIDRTASHKPKRASVSKFAHARAESRGNVLARNYSLANVIVEKIAPFGASPALDGAKFFMTAFFMFNHLGSDHSWGALAKARYVNLHVPGLFAILGYQLTRGFRKLASPTAFVLARAGALHPMYLLSLLPCLAVLLSQCRPETHRDEFDWTSQSVDNLNLASSGRASPS